MKRYVFPLLVFLCLLIPQAWAAAPGFVAMDQSKNLIQTFTNDVKPIATSKVGAKPTSVVKLSDGSGYLLLCAGSKKAILGADEPASLYYLDQNLIVTNRKVDLPGIIVRDFYFAANNTWILITSGAETKNLSRYVANVYNVKTGALQQYNLDAMPVAFKLNSENNLFAIATIGVTEKKIKPAVTLIDLVAAKSESYPVAANPGAIFFTKSQVVVACGGINPKQKYSTEITAEIAEVPVPAKLLFITRQTGAVKELSVGYSPLAVIQDQANPDVFYTGSTKDIYAQQLEGMLQIVRDGASIAQIKISADPVQIIPTQAGTLCVLGYLNIFFVSAKDLHLLTEQTYDMWVEDFTLDESGTFGYLSTDNGEYLDAYNVTTGQKTNSYKINKGGIFSGGIGRIFRRKYPPVVSTDQIDDKPSYISQNYRSFFSKNGERLYTVAPAGVGAIDVKSNQVIAIAKIGSKIQGIHATPNQKHIVAVQDKNWYLLDQTAAKPVLTVNFTFYNENDTAPLQGYYSPDGNRLIIPYSTDLYVVDTANGKMVGRFKTACFNSVIVWP